MERIASSVLEGLVNTLEIIQEADANVAADIDAMNVGAETDDE